MASGDAAPIAAKDAAGKLAREAQLDCSGGIVAESGKMSADLVRVKTPKPATPDAVVATLLQRCWRVGILRNSAQKASDFHVGSGSCPSSFIRKADATFPASVIGSRTGANMMHPCVIAGA